jgi:chemotaxis-related protein WspD
MATEEEFASAVKLLSRVPGKDYLDEWTVLIQAEKRIEDTFSEQSVVIFRLGIEWLALSILAFSEITTTRTIHRIPHRSSPLLLGAVNLRGQLQVCFALDTLLEIAKLSKAQFSEKAHCLMAIKKNEMIWVFPADEVYGIFRCDLATLQNVPITSSKAKINYLKGIFTWENKSVRYLDEDVLFTNLQRSLV